MEETLEDSMWLEWQEKWTVWSGKRYVMTDFMC